MLYQITHSTIYNYAEIVPVCHNLVHLAPRSSARQVCRKHQLTISPKPSTFSRRVDYFGNHLDSFSLHEGHRRLSLTAVSLLEVSPALILQPALSPPWEIVRQALRSSRGEESLAAYQFAFDSPRIASSGALAAYAQPAFPPGRPILEGVLDLTARIFKDFVYDPSATKVHTPLEDAFRMRRGVCQDLAHIEIGALRSLGLAARYVSGYLQTQPPAGQKRLVGADASHAWLSVYCGDVGWVDVDPTNNVVVASDHITLAWGRDYSDVPPVQGVFIGGGQHTIDVSVDVAPQELVA